METSFRKLVISLFLVLGSFSIAPTVMADDYPPAKKVKWYGEMGNGFMMIGTVLNSGDNCCTGGYYFAYQPGAAIRMGLNTALESEDAVAWFINSQGQYVNSDNFAILELYRDPIGYPPSTNSAFIGGATAYSYNNILLYSGMVSAFSTEGTSIQMMTHQQWFGAYGDARPIGALDGLLTAFNKKTRFALQGAAPVTQYELIPCGFGFGC